MCLAVASCALPRNATYSFQVAVAADANDLYAGADGPVFVWDKAVAAKIAPLTAADWFARKMQFRQDDPDERALTICEWEWVPGQAVPEINLMVPAAARQWARGVFVFAKYRSEGPHRSSVTPGVAARLELGRDDLSLRPIAGVPSPSYGLLHQDEACQLRQTRK